MQTHGADFIAKNTEAIREKIVGEDSILYPPCGRPLCGQGKPDDAGFEVCPGYALCVALGQAKATVSFDQCGKLLLGRRTPGSSGTLRNEWGVWFIFHRKVKWG